MTQKEFNELPFLLDRRRVREASGLTDEDITQLRKSGDLRAVRFGNPVRRRNAKGKYPKGHKYKSKYLKVDVAKLCGFTV